MVHVSTVRRWEMLGELTPIRDTDGWAIYFDAEEVARLEEKYPPTKRKKRMVSSDAKVVGGRPAARVFELIKSGRSFQEIVIETGMDPWRVREIEREYELGGHRGVEREKARQRAAADERRRQHAHERQATLEEREQMKMRAKEELARKLLRAGVPPEAIGQAIATPAPILPPAEEKKRTG